MNNTKALRERFSLTQKDLSELFNIPLATIKNWDSRNCMPDYVYTLMYMALAGVCRPEYSDDESVWTRNVHDSAKFIIG